MVNTFILPVVLGHKVDARSMGVDDIRLRGKYPGGMVDKEWCTISRLQESEATHINVSIQFGTFYL